MFNIYQFENEIKEQLTIQKKKVIEDRWKEKRSNQKDEMVQNYKKRLNQFLSEMKQKPIKIYDDIVDMKLNLINKFRPEDESKMIGPKIMKMRDYPSRAQSPNNQNTKHNQNMSLDLYETNKSLNQSNPFMPYKPHQYRSREKNKELYGDMKFKPSFKNERVVDSLCEQGIGGLRSDYPYVPQTAPMNTYIFTPFKETYNNNLSKIRTKKVSLRDQIGKIRIRPSTTAGKNEGQYYYEDNNPSNLGINQQIKSNRDGNDYLYQNNYGDRQDSHIHLQNQIYDQQATGPSYNAQSLMKARKNLSNHQFGVNMYEGNMNTQNGNGKQHLNRSLPLESNAKSLTSNDASDDDQNIVKRKEHNTLSQKNDITIQRQRILKNDQFKSDKTHSVQINTLIHSQRNEHQPNNNISSVLSSRNKNFENMATPDRSFYQNQQKSQHHNNNSIKGQNILPILHQKTHFKALAELAIKQPLLKNEIKEVYDEEFIGNIIETNQIFDDQTTSDAIQVMNDCNIFRTKNKHVKGIRGTLRNTASNFNESNHLLNYNSSKIH